LFSGTFKKKETAMILLPVQFKPKIQNSRRLYLFDYEFEFWWRFCQYLCTFWAKKTIHRWRATAT